MYSRPAATITPNQTDEGRGVAGHNGVAGHIPNATEANSGTLTEVPFYTAILLGSPFVRGSNRSAVGVRSDAAGATDAAGAAGAAGAADVVGEAGGVKESTSLTDSSLRQTVASLNFWLVFFTVFAGTGGASWSKCTLWQCPRSAPLGTPDGSGRCWHSQEEAGPTTASGDRASLLQRR